MPSTKRTATLLEQVAAAAATELQEADEAARMATEWLALLARGPVGDAAARAGLAGLAAAVIVCSSPRCGASSVQLLAAASCNSHCTGW